MKSSIILSIILMSIVGKANAQFLELGDKWIYDYRDHSLFNGTYTEKFESIEVVSDTMIDGHPYFKLVASAESPCGIFRAVEYLREEDGKVYRLSRNQVDEHLMIDFADQDAYEMTYEAGFQESLIQTNVINDSSLIEVLPSGEQLHVTYQRIINNSSYSNDETYRLSNEVGYILPGLLFPDIGTGLCDPLQTITLRCKISGSDTIRLTDLGCYESSIISSVSEVVREAPLVYPNPTSGVVNIEENYELISIQNVAGNVIKVHSTTEVDLTDYPSGVYFLTVKSISGKATSQHIVLKM